MSDKSICLSVVTSARNTTKVLQLIKDMLGDRCLHIVEENNIYSHTLPDYTKYEIRVLNEFTDEKLFTEQIIGMMNYYSTLESEGNNIRHGLLQHINVANNIYTFFFNLTDDSERNNFLYSKTLKVAEVVGGCVIMFNKDVLTSSGTMLLSSKGETKATKHSIKIDSDYMYERNELSDYDITVYNESKEFLNSKGILFRDDLPFSLRRSEVSLKSVEDICKRSICLFVTSLFSTILLSNRGYSEAIELVNNLRSKFDFDLFLSENESAYLKLDNITNDLRVKFACGIESCNVLLWSIGLIEDLQDINSLVRLDDVVNLFESFNSLDDMVNKANLKSVDILFKERDLSMRYHWAFHEAASRDVRHDLINPIISQHRHKTLNWVLTNMYGTKWDKIDTPA